VRPDRKAAVRIAARHLWRNRGSSVVCALAMALPMSAVVAASVIAPGSTPGDSNTGDVWWTLAMIFLTAQFAAFGLLLVGAMVGAAMLVSVRRNERMLALLTAVGATRRILFLVVSAHGILIGSVAAVFTVAIGLLGGASLVLFAGGVPRFDAVSILGIAVATVLVGWAVSLVPAAATRSLDVTRILRDAPQPPRAIRVQTKAGQWTVVFGMGGFLVAAVAGHVGSVLPDGWPSVLLSSASMMLATPSAVTVLLGAALVLPSIFRMFGRWARSPGSAARLAARDAERGGTRSLATATSVMAACFLISAYVSFFGANETWVKETHQWGLQQNQVAVDLVTYGDPGSESILQRELIDDPATLDRATAILEDTLPVADPRLLDGVLGPHWGTPIDDFENYSGFSPVDFPTEGLPHPRLEPEGVCAVPAEDGGPSRALCTGTPLELELPQLTPTIWIGDAGDLALILGRNLDAATRSALDAGSVIALDPRYVSADGTVTIEWWGQDQFVPEDEPGEFLPAGTPLTSVRMDADWVAQEHPVQFGIFLSPAAAAEAGLDTVPARILAQSTRWVSYADAEATSAALATIHPDMSVWAEHGPERPDRTWSWGATGIAAGIMLVLAVSAIGLSRFEGARTDATLRALGASSGIRRRINGWYALFVIGVGALSGTAAGALSIFGTASALRVSAPQLPLAQLGVMAIFVPLLAAGIAWLLPVGSRRMPPAE
jgi:hypothetical protein